MSPKPSDPKMKNPVAALSKKDMQNLVAVVLGVVMALAAFWQFVMKPLQHRVRDLRSELEKNTRAFRENRALADSAPNVSSEYRKIGAELLAVMKTDLPPDVNSVAWASDRIMAAAATVPKHLEIVSISDAGVDLKPSMTKASKMAISIYCS